MATEDRRLVFVRKWYQRGKEESDPFDQFFYLWIALVIAAQHLRTLTGIRFMENDTDRKRILDYLLANVPNVLQALRGNHENMVKLSRRRGTRHRNPIVDTGNAELRKRFCRLADHYTQGTDLSEEVLVKSVGELLNKVRNNLFHGIKVYDDREDIELLSLVNPLLIGILQKCENL